MPTNKLRRHARELLSLAIKAHDDGHIADARSLTLRAGEFLEEAISLEELRYASSSAVPARSVHALHKFREE